MVVEPLSKPVSATAHDLAGALITRAATTTSACRMPRATLLNSWRSGTGSM